MAKDVQVSQHARYAHLVALDVIRREPPAEWSGHPWYDTGTPSGSPAIPAPREPADDAYWLGEPPRDRAAALGTRLIHDGSGYAGQRSFFPADCCFRMPDENHQPHFPPPTWRSSA